MIAGSSEESEYGNEEHSDAEKNQAHIDEMRKKLLGGLTDSGKRSKEIQGSDDNELDVQF